MDESEAPKEKRKMDENVKFLSVFWVLRRSWVLVIHGRYPHGQGGTEAQTHDQTSKRMCSPMG